MKIITRLVLGGIVPAILGLGFSVMFYTLAERNKEIAERGELGGEIGIKAFSLSLIGSDQRFLAGDERPFEQWRAARGALGSILSNAMFRNPEVEDLRAGMLKDVARLDAIFDQLQATVAQRRTGEISETRFRELSPRLVGQIGIVTQDLMARAVELDSTSHDEAIALQAMTTRAVIWMAAGISIFATAAFVLFGRSLLGPIRELEQGAREIAQGNFGHRIHSYRKDELAELSHAFDTMAEGLQARDVELARRTEAIARSEKTMRTIVDTAPDALFIVDGDGTIVMANPGGERVFGYRPEELLGQKIEILVPDHIRATHAVSRIDFLKNEDRRRQGFEAQFNGVQKNGKPVPLEIVLSAIDLEGEPMTLAVARDITERRRAEREIAAHASELERSNAELSQFAYVASHDLQEPLRMVDSYLGLLARRYQGQLDKDADEFIGFATDGARRMKILINDLLSYSRVSNREMAHEDVDTGEIAKTVLRMLEQRIAENDAVVELGDLPEVNGDPRLLERLFLNVIDNGIKYRSDAAPKITVGAVRKNGFWEFTVADNGIGIDPQFKEKVFVIFTRLHSRDKYEGTGIGLASCKRVVERHGGQIWVEPGAEGGSVFHFTLPVGGQDQTSGGETK